MIAIKMMHAKIMVRILKDNVSVGSGNPERVHRYLSRTWQWPRSWAPTEVSTSICQWESSGLLSQSLCWEVSLRDSKIMTDLMMPARPDAPSVCPMADLRAPTTKGSSLSDVLNALAMASALDGVTRRCSCSMSFDIRTVSQRRRSPRAYTSRIICSCAAALGRVMPGVRPSWLRPVARMTARIVSPSRSALDSRFRTTVATPSPLEYPLARWSKLYDFAIPSQEAVMGHAKPVGRI